MVICDICHLTTVSLIGLLLKEVLTPPLCDQLTIKSTEILKEHDTHVTDKDLWPLVNKFKWQGCLILILKLSCLKGARLNSGCSGSDFKVMVGDLNCAIDMRTDTEIQCKIKQTFPGSTIKNQKVMVGALYVL